VVWLWYARPLDEGWHMWATVQTAALLGLWCLGVNSSLVGRKIIEKMTVI